MKDETKLVSNRQEISSVDKIDGKISKSFNNCLKGFTGTSFNAGHIATVTWKRLYAGSKVKYINLEGAIRMRTPIAPLQNRLATTLVTTWTPRSRVWKDAEKFEASKGRANINYDLFKEPTISLSTIITGGKSYTDKIITNSAVWRDCIAAQYLPRIGIGQGTAVIPDAQTQVSILPFRIYNANYNDLFMNKMFDTKLIENNASTVTQTELDYYFPQAGNQWSGALKSQRKRAKKRNSYWTNYRAGLVGKSATHYNDPTNASTQNMMTHTEWQKQISEARQQAENEGFNDWDIIAKIRGTRPATQQKSRILNETVIEHNYTQVAQTTENTASDVKPEYQSLGTTGAFSWTAFNINIPIYEEFIESGYITIYAITDTDVIYGNGITRELLNVNWDDQYRPELKDMKQDVLYTIEQSTSQTAFQNNVAGYKRRFSEEFNMPVIVNGCLSPYDFNDAPWDDGRPSTSTQSTSESYWITQADSFIAQATDTFRATVTQKLNPWQSNADFEINRTHALQQPILAWGSNQLNTGNNPYKITGQPQFRLTTSVQMIADLPIDEAIKNDFKKEAEV